MTKDVQDLMLEVERVRDAFHTALFAGPDPTSALTLAAPGCELSILPAGSGAAGPDALHGFLAEGLVRPADLSFTRLSRTGDRWRVAQEDTVRFTHDRELPWVLPGVAPTHRPVEVLVVTTVAVRRSLVTSYRALWDQVSLWEQVGVLDRLGISAPSSTPPTARPATATDR